MILMLVLILPLAGGVLAWMVSRSGSARSGRVVCAGTLVFAAGLLIAEAIGAPATPYSHFFKTAWVSEIGISFFLALDGLSLLMVLLTLLLGIVAIATTPRDNIQNPGAFLFHLMASLSGLVGVFMAADLFLFFVCYEVMLVPMYFLISMWGRENRSNAAIKFFLFTQASGLLMLTAIVGVALVRAQSDAISFTQLGGSVQGASPTVLMFLMLGFAVAFAVKLPVVPFHSWQPDAYSAAPVAAGIVLAGLMSKAGAYGLLRFAVPMFPEAAQEYAFWAMLVGVISVLYGAVLAFAQTDFRRLIAYSSMSHLGFVMLGAFAMNDLAFKGAVMTMVCHGISVSGLFMLEQAVRARTQTSDLSRMGGLWQYAPRLGTTGLVFALATLGIPGLGNFVGEFLILLGVFKVSVPMAAAAAVGMVLSAIYALWMMQRIFFGARDVAAAPVKDVSWGYLAVSAPLIAALFWLGLFPQRVLDLAGPNRAVSLSAGPMVKVLGQGPDQAKPVDAADHAGRR